MAKAPKYSVTHPVYGTHTRDTKRTYTHLVLSTGHTPAVAEQHTQASLAYQRKQLVEYEAVVARGIVPAGFSMLTVDQYRGWAADIRNSLPTLEQGPERARVAAEQRAAGNAFGCHGWAGRLDLAVKLAEGAVRDGYNRVTILDAVTGQPVPGWER